MVWRKHVKAALWFAAMLAFLGIIPMTPGVDQTAYAMSFSEDLLQKAFEEEFGDMDDLEDLEELSEEYEEDELYELTQQYMEMFGNGEHLVETFQNDVIEKPELEMKMTDDGQIRYYLPNGEYYDVTVPNGTITSDPVRIKPSSEVAAVITKDGENSSIFNNWNFSDPGHYQIKMLFYSLGSENYESIRVYEVHHYFTIIGKKVNHLGVIPAPEGFEIISVKKDGIQQPIEHPKGFFLNGDGYYEIHYQDSWNGSIYTKTSFERDTIAPFLEFSTDITEGPVEGSVEFYKMDDRDQVYIYYNGNAAIAKTNQMEFAGKYTLEVMDEVGNRRMYDLEIKQTYRIFETKTIILALIFLLGVGIRFLLRKRNMKVI